MSVDAGGPAAKTGIRSGDVVGKVNGQPVNDAEALSTFLAGHKAGDVISLELKDRTGVIKRADVQVFMTPRLIGIADRTLLVNRMLIDFRARTLTQSDPLQESVIRLNLAAALARVENWADARVELLRVKLPDGPAVGNGTVQYLLGLCADKLGNRSEAEAAWRAAAASDSLLTEDGPPVKELAEAMLAQPPRR
jgi:membrane-associated protease RseP (regulator of RpoE activity)